MKPLVVAPMQREAKALGHSAVVCSGRDAMRVIERRAPAGPMIGVLVIAGVCGGLDPSLTPGSVILARSVRSPRGIEVVPDSQAFTAVGGALRAANFRFVSSKLLTVEVPLMSCLEKTRLWNDHGAGGVDMETSDLAAAAEQSGIPWLAIRAVLDPASSGLPDSLKNWSADLSERAILRQVVRRPWEWPFIARLGWQMRLACQALRAAMDVVIPTLESIEGEKAPNVHLPEFPQTPVALDR